MLYFNEKGRKATAPLTKRKMATLFKEKRYSSRVNLRSPLRYRILGTSKFGNTITENISLGGVGFINQDFLTPESIVQLEFNIFSRILKTIGRIAWSVPLSHSDRYRVGVEFQEIDSSTKKGLTDYIDLQASKS